MNKSELGIQESFRWIIRSIIVICGISLSLVIGWQLGKWWVEKRPVGYAQQIICLSENQERLDEIYWRDFFAYWLLPGQEIHPYQLRSLERYLLETGYFSAVSLDLKGSNLWARYKLSAALAKVGDGDLFLYESGKIQPRLYSSNTSQVEPLESSIKLVGVEDLAFAWPLAKMQEVTSFLRIIQGHDLFKNCTVNAKEWQSVQDPVSEFILVFFLESGQKRWIRLGSVHFKRPDLILQKLSKAYELMEIKSALWADLRFETIVLLGYDHSKS